MANARVATVSVVYEVQRSNITCEVPLLSPAHRGRGILVAPGFRPAAGPASRFPVGAKTQKLLVIFFFNLNMTFLATWGCASDFLKMLTKFKMASRGQLQKKNCRRKSSKTISQILF